MSATSPAPATARKKVTIGTLRSMKTKGIPASYITAYDYPSACFAEAAGIDMILVGDSGGMTMLGYKNTLPVTMDEMLHFTKAVCRGAKTAFVIGDMPFMSYQSSNELAQLNAGRFIAEAGCDCIKLEGGRKMAERVRAIADAGIAVMGHIGLTPQSLSAAGGYRVYGKTRDEFKSLLDDALALEDAGASFVLLEAIPEEPASYVREALKVPVYGIGAGRHMDGQLLILHDLIGAFVGDVSPKFARRYANVGQVITDALAAFNRDIKGGDFPAAEHLYPIDPEEVAKIRAYVEERRKSA
jgi:3-methyl-2-oxobutanoate hydroxymethyltransferase